MSMEPAAAFHMADIRNKRPTRRRAVAIGELLAGPVAWPMIVERRLPKGDALVMAEIAGLQGAKQASALMPLCHPLPLELVRVRCEPIPERQAIRVYCECATEARTGVEMEALAGANAALLTLYDLSKPVEPALAIGGIRLLFKEGGKSGLWIHPDGMSEADRAHYRPRDLARLDGVPCAVVTLSDRASRGEYADESGPVLQQGLRRLGGEVRDTPVLADGIEPLASQLQALAAAGIRLCLCTGGTGLGPNDLTPEALRQVGGRRVEGLAEMIRSESARHTPLAWLSRAEVVQVGGMLVVALPGSPRAAQQGMDILAPLLAHALAMIDGRPHA
ncbi:bifunctional molybdenum cofactor biosynthesis protein MoaC/MoaB [Flavobacterium sp. MXW15]|uniref:Bifunctional molybdenum cofactor biosynthesis protein MoaC/MoaB n=1 Tax=Xanthomonas chitinilytica TaxID=2989819 RepID=A0ABT3JVL2_9XANT|nr:bifunctional molybdenum cofactor biosynthesis protein MoaC/MoaB [Xanthomonas sp. H13-6]MCW4454849.1 bifunctional molybdenum cofactor biosynthesis protein MoaC/MoaB [Flavobacterium sp. MXW15]MCW4472523.1 bifunctional molybdenum cofactor biosynthesis protein MoaC/MoaB [Xanthomonas sp. H13-6]